MGTLPTFLAISGFVFLAVMLSYSTLRRKADAMKLVLDQLKFLAQERQKLVSYYLSYSDTSFLNWPQLSAPKADTLLRQQNEVLDQVDKAAVSSKLSPAAAKAFQKHFEASQIALDQYRQLVNQYNQLVTRKPNAYVARLLGYRPA